MAREERRINTYFRRTIEETELWNFLQENHPDDMATWLKYYARLGIQQSQKISSISSSTPLAPKPRRTRKSAKKEKQDKTNPNNNNIVQASSDKAVVDEFEQDPLSNLEIKIQEVDPVQNLTQSINRFIPEEDDEEILELVKQQKTSQNETESTK